MKIDRKKLKQNGRRALRANYWFAVAVCFLLSFFGAEYIGATAWIKDTGFSPRESDAIVLFDAENYSNWDALTDLFDLFPSADEETDEQPDDTAATNIPEDSDSEENATFSLRKFVENLYSLTFDTLTEGASFLFKFMTGGYDIFALDRTLDGVLMLISALAEIAFVYFVLKMLVVGGKRFYIENQRRFDRRTRISTLLYPFFSGRFLHTVWVMFVRTVLLDLWSLTIVGGFIKSYEYRMIPYILADRPELTRKEAFRLSKHMMKGCKWQMFLFDLSFIGWGVLSALTLGLVGLFYYHPYKAAALAEFYATRKEEIEGEVRHG